MNTSDRSTDYLSGVRQRLAADGFRCSDAVTYKSHTFRFVAKRTRFQLDWGGFATIFFVFAEFASVDEATIKEFARRAFDYARKSSGVPLLPRGLYGNLTCLPVAVVDRVDSCTAGAVCSDTPPKHWGAAEMPVVYDLSTTELHYFRKTPRWRALFWEREREIIRGLLGP